MGLICTVVTSAFCDPIESRGNIASLRFDHRIVKKFSLRYLVNTFEPIEAISLKLEKPFITKVDVDWALGIQPCSARLDPTILLMSAIGFDEVLDFVQSMYLDHPSAFVIRVFR